MKTNQRQWRQGLASTFAYFFLSSSLFAEETMFGSRWFHPTRLAHTPWQKRPAMPKELLSLASVMVISKADIAHYFIVRLEL